MRRHVISGLAFLGGALLVWPVIWPAARGGVRLLMPRPGRLIAEVDTLTLAPPSKLPGGGGYDSSATFRVANSGGSPVTIRDVLSGCDCAVARVDPRVITPGSTGVVEVKGKPSDKVDRTVMVTLLTDSPETPEVRLKIRRQGRDQLTPPYLMTAYGDLTYNGTLSDIDTREITVLTAQETGHLEEARVISSLPFLRIDLRSSVGKQTTEPAISIVKHVYSVRLTSPPHNAFQGEVTIEDPWNESRHQQIMVFGDLHEPFVVSPPRLLLSRESLSGETGRATLRVTHLDRRASPVVQPVGEAASLLRVVPIESDDPGASLFEVRLNSAENRKPEGTFSLIIHPSPGSSEAILVPVKILGENGE